MVEFTKKKIDEITKDPVKYATKSTVKELETFLRHASDKYYNTGESIITDKIFDLLKEKLKEKSPKNKFLKQVGAPVVEEEKVKLPYIMNSLDKVKPETKELDKWLKKYKGKYVVSDKLDGTSGQLYKDKNGNMKLFTRGDSQSGRDISKLVEYLNFGDVDFDDLPNGMSVRGEIVMSKKNYQKIKDDAVNARAATNGLVVSVKKNINVKVAKLADFVTYAILHPSMTQSAQMKQLDDYGFNVTTYQVKSKLTDDYLNKYLVERNEKGEYEIDGLVVIDSSKVYPIANEKPDENPDYGFAFKAVMDDQIALTTIVDVTWDISKHGLLKPTIQVIPVIIGGTTITNCTANNAKFVEDNELGPGAVIKLIRSGNVIPKIHEIIKIGKTGAKMPDVAYYWNESGVDAVAKNLVGSQNDIMQMKKMVFFFKTIGVKYLDEGIMTKFVDNGYKDIIKLISADRKKLTKIEGLGEKMINKIFNGIEAGLKNTRLSVFMAASGLFGRGVGERKLKVITDAYPNIMQIMEDEEWDEDEITDNINNLEGFSDITTTKFIEGFGEFAEFFDKVVDVIDINYLKNPPKDKKKKTGTKTTGNGLKGMKIVFTGFRDKEMEKFIEDNDGKMTTSVSGNTSLVVYVGEDSESSKVIKAKELKIKMMTKDEFKKKYMN